MNNAEKVKNINEINSANKEYKPFIFDVIAKSKIFAIIVAAVFVVGMVSFFVFGFNRNIDFAGGTILEYNIGRNLEASDVDEIKNIVTEALGEGMIYSVERSGNPPQQVVIKTHQLDNDARNTVGDILAEKYEKAKEDIFVRANNAEPKAGDAFIRSAILSVIIAPLLMFVYMLFRFDVKSGLAAVICLLFDLFVILTFYSITQISINAAVIAALLAVLAYSMNASIILFGRVRENVNLEKGKSTSYAAIINKSVNQTIVRSICITITILCVLILLIIIGVPSVRAFALPLIVGVISGFFSSLCLAGPLRNIFGGTKQVAKGKAK